MSYLVSLTVYWILVALIICEKEYSFSYRNGKCVQMLPEPTFLKEGSQRLFGCIACHNKVDFCKCMLDEIFSVRLGLPALLHISGAFICCLAFILGVTGHLRRTCFTLISSITYICGSIVLSTAVLMVVCVVDDELAPRMRLNAAGEPSKFGYIYVRHAQLDKELGIPPVESWRRGSLANCFSFSHGISSRRNSRRNSQISFTNPNLLFVQEV
uniref:Uncharacterized protein n=1 Tax=Heterorhabditis bacteriophora TaxID=37862 RepID=A0A1I7X8H6_HETBA